MQLFVQQGWKQLTLQALNHCRMYLKVFLLSNIVISSGECIAQQFWDWPHQTESSFEWPRMAPSSQQLWRLWIQALSSALNLGRNQQLALSLGWWFAQIHPSGWYYHQQTNSLWEVGETMWICHGGIPRHTWQCSFHGLGEVEQPLPLRELTKATIACCGQKLILTGFNTCEQVPIGVDLCQQLCGAVFARQWNLVVHLEGIQWEFQETLSQGASYAVSDRSFKDKSGAAAWIIEGLTLALRLTAHWHMPRLPPDHSSLFSELADIIGILYILTSPQKTVKPTFWLACNGLSVV